MKIKNYFDNSIKLISNNLFEDKRGFFSELYNKKYFIKNNISVNFVQDNFSFTPLIGTFRGLHFQTPPYEQAKYVKVLSGEIYDIVLDIRRNSKTYGKYKAFKLNSKEWNSLFIDIGFAHGLLTLSHDVMLYYKVSNYYSKENDFTINWKDKILNIDLPFNKDKVMTSEKDSFGLNFNDFESPFI